MSAHEMSEFQVALLGWICGGAVMPEAKPYCTAAERRACAARQQRLKETKHYQVPRAWQELL